VATGVSTLATPDVLGGRYRVAGAVGRGAIAEVLRARDERTGEDVALKVLYPHLRESAAVVERFRREVEIVRRVSHAHVLPIRDLGESDGLLYLVMPYYPGGDLADRLARAGRLPPAEVAALAEQLAGALAAAHRAGVVHRDVKPSNVLLGAGPGLDVRLVDFGLARTAELSGLTAAAAVLGTPEYMAPEVITDGHADPRSDIYSLGVVLFEAATGRLPFYGDSPYQLMRHHVDTEAPRARTLAADVPPALDEAIARALAKDPLDRFATAGDLARALAAAAPDAAAAPSRALVPVRAEEMAAARRACRRCGGWLVADAAACADCGAVMLRLEHERGGVAVLVTGPGRTAEKIDAWRHVALYKVLDQLPPGSARLARGRRRAPRYPFYVAKGLTPASATALLRQLDELGIESRGERQPALPPREVMAKAGTIVWRYVMAMSVLFQGGTVWGDLIPRGHALQVFAAVGCAGLAAMTTSVLRSMRPLVRKVRPAARDTAGGRLGAVLPCLGSRQDRRLVAHILERLAQIEALGRAEVAAPLAARAAEVSGALAALDERRSHDASVPRDAGSALEALRGEEMTRVVLRGDLLRTMSHLDRLALAVARAGARASAEEAAGLEREIEELAFAADAEAELAALLGSRR
jgi:hypothetical protein